MLQYKIPQNVEVEDTIIGPITMRQLIILAIGGGIAYLFFITLSKTYFFEIWGPPVIFFSLSSIAIAFIEIRGIRFTKWFLLMLEALFLPSKRVWDKRQSTQFLFRHSASKKAPVKKEKIDPAQKKQKQASNLKELTKALDRSENFDEKHESPLGTVKDHELSAAAITEDDNDRHKARIQNIQENEKISAIRGDNAPIRLTPVDTLKKPQVPDDHKEMLNQANN